MKSFIFPFFIIIMLLACEQREHGFTESVELAHEKETFLSHKAISFDIILEFGGKERLDAKMTLLTNSNKGLMELADGNKIVYHGDRVFCSPEMANQKNVRFDAYTWSYFFLFPYKLNDEGTVWTDFPSKKLNDSLFLTQKLTFKSGTGDAPDDWYVVYVDPQTKQIEAAAYIVTANKTKEAAEEDPHAIQYKKYQAVNGVPLAHQWKFWEWTEKDGLTRQLGEASINNFKFIEEVNTRFDIPTDFILVE